MSFDYVELCEKNLHAYGHNEEHLKLLGNLYADDTHFIYELLQNAEDAKAKSVLFQLFGDRLEILHDGREFSADNVKAITQISKSTKGEYTEIGKFGLGFKSVYAITDTPQIYSGDFHFRIEKYIRPSEIPIREIDKEWTTLFVLPFKIQQRQQIYEKISKKIQDLNIRTLLFLTHIEEIKYNIYNIRDICKNGQYLRDRRIDKNGFNKVTVIGQDEDEIFFIFDKKIDDKKVEIAFLYDSKKDTIYSATDTDLVVYFPTAKKTNLGFLLNGNFITTPARDNIPEDDDHNKALIKIAAELLVESIQKVKSANLCNISFLETLPIIADSFPENNMLYSLFEITKNTLKYQNYLPTSTIEFVSAENAVIARPFYLVDLYAPDGKIWLSKEITPDNHPNLFTYLQDSLSIQVITPDTFARGINKNFLDKQTDDWFIKFYIFLSEQKSLWKKKTLNASEGVLLSKPILRTENDELKTPKEEIFLPGENPTADYPMIKTSIASDKEALTFLKALGLDIPKPADSIIQKTFPKYESAPSISKKEYENDLESILNVLKGESQDDKNKLRKKLLNLLIIKCEDEEFRKPSEVYCNDENLKKWFKYSDNIHFADDTLNNDDWRLFDVANLPRRKQLDTLPNDVTKQYFTRYHIIKNYDLDGLNDFIKNISFDNSKILTNIIVSEYQIDNNFFIGKQEYFYIYDRASCFKNNIYQILNNFSWILGKDGELYKPREIIKEDINDEILLDIISLPFDLKKREEKELEYNLAQQGKTIISTDELEKLKAELEETKAKLAEYDTLPKQKEESQDPDEDGWISQYSIDEITISKGSLAPIPNDKGIGDSIKITNQEPSAKISSNTETKVCTPKKAKLIGQCGEDIVKKWLIEEENFNEADIKILNDNENIGTGRDFEVSKNGEIIKIIEVKATEETSDHIFKTSGKQWETGRKEQDKYWIYAVFGVGSQTPKIVPIPNPIKKWKDGDIEANPVNFVIRVS